MAVHSPFLEKMAYVCFLREGNLLIVKLNMWRFLFSSDHVLIHSYAVCFISQIVPTQKSMRISPKGHPYNPMRKDRFDTIHLKDVP